ncbi:MAG: helix-turn-helix transcriptional regulator [Oleibacter sp.]|nr:helix-turn-helix transcriptional regulator [Thalassolituus sp.]
MDEMKPLGLENGMMVYCPGGQPDRDRFLYHSNYSDAFTSDYDSAGGAAHDLTVQLALKQFCSPKHFLVDSLPLVEWRQVEELTQLHPELLTPKAQAIEDASKVHNVEFGFSCLMHTKGRESQNQSMAAMVSGVGLAATGISEDDFVRGILPHTSQIAQAIQLLEMTLRRFALGGASGLYDIPQLSERERNLLGWLADGLRLQDVADNKANKSIDTINKDIKALKKRFNANTREELVAIGMMLGILD